MGAGILPTAIHKGKLYFLFGKENAHADTPGFSDIGGGQDKNESFMETAIREGTEELTGFLGSEADLEKMLKKYGTYNVDFPTRNNGTYRIHIFPYKYDEQLPFYYNNNAQFIHRKLDKRFLEKSTIFEKSEIRWVCVDELLNMKSQFRCYFQTTVETIVNKKHAIYEFIESHHPHTPKIDTFRKTATTTTRNGRKRYGYKKSVLSRRKTN